MNNVILTAILGLGAGAAYASLATGIVLIYKGSGALNFAQGAMAMLGAYTFSAMVNAGIPKVLAALLTIAGAAAVGVLIFFLIIRPLRGAPTLAKVVASIGLLLGFQAFATLVWGSVIELPPSLLPSGYVHALGGSFGADRLWVLGITAGLVTVLWAVYRFTTFGLSTRATAENERSAALLGFNPDVIGATNWLLGSGLAALAGILIVPITGLNIDVLTLMIVPALVAALLGRFDSFLITAAAGIAIGIFQAEISRYWQQPGVSDAIPFALVMLAMIAAGTLIPSRGEVRTSRPPFAPPTQPRLRSIVAVAAVVIVALATLQGAYLASVPTALITATFALSLVVLVGFVGQISIAQMTFAGIGGYAASKTAVHLGLPFPLPILAAAVIVVPAGVILGLPALRVRGVNLAVITLGFAVAVSSVFFQNPSWTGGLSGSPVPNPVIAGFALDAAHHPTRFGVVALILFGVLAIAVMNLRRSGLGQRMLAVRSNERSAAAAGINVYGTKLQAFALSSMIAAVGGAMLTYQTGSAYYASFGPLQSVILIAIAYVGGIGCVSGAVTAGVLATGGPVFVLLSGVGPIEKYWLVLSAAGLVFTAIVNPDGVAIEARRQFTALRARIASGPGSTAPPDGRSTPSARHRPAHSKSSTGPIARAMSQRRSAE